MTDWLKQICRSPFKYGMESLNFVIVKAITVIFNMYGKRLLKLDDDKIIKANEFINNRNVFHMYPINFKDIDQDIGLNILKITQGTINNLVISVPWKAMLSESTLVNITDINVALAILKNTDTIYLSAISQTNSYLDTEIKKNNDLMNTYQEINKLVVHYFNKIDFDIDLMTIVLDNHFRIVIHDCKYYESNISIGKIIINTINGD